MSIIKKDKEAIQRIAKEGKTISRILDEDFPELNYWEIYDIVYSSGGKSALGVKRSIANRLIAISNSQSDKEQQKIIQEVDELVWHLYRSLKFNQKKLDTIRKVLNKLKI